MSTEQLIQNGLNAVRLLRQQKHKLGHPFMINLNSLPQGQFYLEYPDGSITLSVINFENNEYQTIRQLSHAEITALKTSLNLA
ncbi:hypothetical protein [Ferruginibacter sp.]|nr:hypothetical protein [Ferruginibacter sp.]